MRVEQRIGRLDRLGQASERIIVINLSLADTIEDRILTRLYERIGIFRQSIGDLEAILGEEIKNLTMELLSRRLTQEEQDAQIDRAAAAIENRKLHLDRLEQESGRFIGRDQYFEDLLERARTGGEFLSPDDIRALVDHFLQAVWAPSRLTTSEGGAVSSLHQPRPRAGHPRPPGGRALAPFRLATQPIGGPCARALRSADGWPR